jgi:hypothetical protein
MCRSLLFCIQLQIWRCTSITDAKCETRKSLLSFDHLVGAPSGATLHPGGRSVSTTCGLLHKNSVRIEVCECGVVGPKMAYEHANGTRAISAGTAGRRCAASGAASACWRTPKRSTPTGRWAALAASKGYGCASQGPHGSWSFDGSSTRKRNAKLRRVAPVIAASSRIHGPKVLCSHHSFGSQICDGSDDA